MPQTNSLQGKESLWARCKNINKNLGLPFSKLLFKEASGNLSGWCWFSDDWFQTDVNSFKKQVKNKATQGDIKSSIGALFYNFLVLLLPGNNLSTNLYQQLFKASSNRIFS